MNEFAAFVALFLAVIYWVRLTGLVYNRHGWLFVANQALNGAACIYASYDLWVHGFDVPGCLIVALAASALMRSRTGYVDAVTRPADLSDYDLTQVHGGHK